MQWLVFPKKLSSPIAFVSWWFANGNVQQLLRQATESSEGSPLWTPNAFVRKKLVHVTRDSTLFQTITDTEELKKDWIQVTDPSSADAQLLFPERRGPSTISASPSSPIGHLSQLIHQCFAKDCLAVQNAARGFLPGAERNAARLTRVIGGGIHHFKNRFRTLSEQAKCQTVDPALLGPTPIHRKERNIHLAKPVRGSASLTQLLQLFALDSALHVLTGLETECVEASASQTARGNAGRLSVTRYEALRLLKAMDSRRHAGEWLGFYGLGFGLRRSRRRELGSLARTLAVHLQFFGDEWVRTGSWMEAWARGGFGGLRRTTFVRATNLVDDPLSEILEAQQRRICLEREWGLETAARRYGRQGAGEIAGLRVPLSDLLEPSDAGVATVAQLAALPPPPGHSTHRGPQEGDLMFLPAENSDGVQPVLPSPNTITTDTDDSVSVTEAKTATASPVPTSVCNSQLCFESKPSDSIYVYSEAPPTDEFEPEPLLSRLETLRRALPSSSYSHQSTVAVARDFVEEVTITLAQALEFVLYAVAVTSHTTEETDVVDSSADSALDDTRVIQLVAEALRLLPPVAIIEFTKRQQESQSESSASTPSPLAVGGDRVWFDLLGHHHNSKGPFGETAGDFDLSRLSENRPLDELAALLFPSFGPLNPSFPIRGLLTVFVLTAVRAILGRFHLKFDSDILMDTVQYGTRLESFNNISTDDDQKIADAICFMERDFDTSPEGRAAKASRGL